MGRQWFALALVGVGALVAATGPGLAATVTVTVDLTVTPEAGGVPQEFAGSATPQYSIEWGENEEMVATTPSLTWSWDFGANSTCLTPPATDSSEEWQYSTIGQRDVEATCHVAYKDGDGNTVASGSGSDTETVTVLSITEALGRRHLWWLNKVAVGGQVQNISDLPYYPAGTMVQAHPQDLPGTYEFVIAGNQIVRVVQCQETPWLADVWTEGGASDQLDDVIVGLVYDGWDIGYVSLTVRRPISQVYEVFTNDIEDGGGVGHATHYRMRVTDHWLDALEHPFLYQEAFLSPPNPTCQSICPDENWPDWEPALDGRTSFRAGHQMFEDIYTTLYDPALVPAPTGQNHADAGVRVQSGPQVYLGGSDYGGDMSKYWWGVLMQSHTLVDCRGYSLQE